MTTRNISTASSIDNSIITIVVTVTEISDV